MEDLERARRLFIRFDGSRFYMSRDGVIEEYERYGVPPELEGSWLQELTDVHLAEIGSANGWRTVDFLLQHVMLDRLEQLLSPPPSGVLWQRCAYEEELLRYLDRCGDGQVAGPVRAPLCYSADVLEEGLARVETNAQALHRRVRAERSVARVDKLLAGVSRRRAAAGNSPIGYWRWQNLEMRAVPAQPSRWIQ